MIAVDTNVLVRFLVRDDEKQSRIAAALFKRAVDRADRIFFPEIVLVETVWVLSRSYGFSREEIARVLRDLLRSKNAAFSSVDRLERAVRAYELGPGGFADYLVREDACDRGCTEVFTFDKVLLNQPGYSRP